MEADINKPMYRPLLQRRQEKPWFPNIVCQGGLITDLNNVAPDKGRELSLGLTIEG